MDDKKEKIILCTEDLEVELLAPGGNLFSERFASAGVIKQVVLHGNHRFCQPEQKLGERKTCHGQGLCSEFVWDELAEEAAPGESFPKLGVGLLRQRPEGGPYDMWKHYETTPFPTKVQVLGNKAVFEQEAVPCLGVAARLIRTVEAYRNILTVTTVLENRGERILKLQEYQHNFVAIDDLPIGPGYQLEIPFDGTIHEISESTVQIEDYRTPARGIMEACGQRILWKKDMEKTACHKVTEREQLLPCGTYEWRMSHRESAASLCERVQFIPSKLVIWGIEHCMCSEVYGDWYVKPGERRALVRTWRFEDDQTGAR